MYGLFVSNLEKMLSGGLSHNPLSPLSCLDCEKSLYPSFMMIRPPVQYIHRPVELLHKDEAHHLVGKGHA